MPLINEEPALDPGLFLRSLGKETFGGGFYNTWADVHQLLPQISFACHFLYSQDPVMAGKVTVLPSLCYLDTGPSERGDAGHFCLSTPHFLSLSLQLIWLVWRWLPKSRVTACTESSVYLTLLIQVLLSLKNTFLIGAILFSQATAAWNQGFNA